MPTIILPPPISFSWLPGAYFRFGAKQPDDVDSYTLDFTAWATSVPGDSLVSCTLGINPPISANPIGLDAAGVPQVTNNGAVVLLTGGAPAQDYALLWVATAESGRSLTVLTMLYCPPAIVPAETAIIPTGYGVTSGQDILTSLAAALPTTPLGLRVGQWWLNQGAPQQVPNSWPTSPNNLLPGSFWLNNGVVYATLSLVTIPATLADGTAGSAVLTSLVQGLPATPLNLHVGQWWLNQGVPNQIPATWPANPAGLFPGSYYLLNGVVAQTTGAAQVISDLTGGTPGDTLFTQLTAGFPNSPVGLAVGRWWMNDGLPQQVPATWPAAPNGLSAGVYWLNNGIVAQIP